MTHCMRAASLTRVQCKLLLDAGRLLFLQAKGFNVDVKRVVPPHVTTDNLLIFASKQFS